MPRPALKRLQPTQRELQAFRAAAADKATKRALAAALRELNRKPPRAGRIARVTKIAELKLARLWTAAARAVEH